MALKKKIPRQLKTLKKYGVSVAPPTLQQKQDIMKAVVEDILPIRAAIDTLKLPKLTLAIWLSEDTAFREFYGWLQRQFVSNMEDYCVSVIREAIINRDWKAAAWYLERRCGYSIPLSSTSQGKITVEFKDDPFKKSDGMIMAETESVKNVKIKQTKKETE